MQTNQKAEVIPMRQDPGDKLRYPDLKARIEGALERHPRAPSEHGRLAWIAREFKTRFDVIVTRETVRRWVAGEAEPRHERREQLSQILGVTSTWLMTGYDPVADAKTNRTQGENAAADIVAGLLKLNGWTVSRPDAAKADIRAGRDGRHYDFAVFAAVKTITGEYHSSLTSAENTVTLVLLPVGPFAFDIVEVRGDVSGKVTITKSGDGYVSDTAKVIPITDLAGPI